MALFQVTNFLDSGLGSLRQAILDANSAVGQDTIEFNSSLTGGTINLTSGELLISDSLTVNGLGANSLAIDAGGTSRVFNIFNFNSQPEVTLNGLTISGGQGDGFFGYGGGITNYGLLTINNSTITKNFANFAAGIQNIGTITIANSTIFDNTATSSFGGFYNVGQATIINSTISGNQASFFGGGIFNSNLLTIENSTITGNSGSDGGGIFSFGGADVLINNTIIANSVGGDCVNINAIGNNNLIEDGSCNAFLSGDPNLGILQDNGGTTLTHALLSGSIAIDAGNNSSIPSGVTTDQRGVGFHRIVNGIVDIGAFEVQQNSPPHVTEFSSVSSLLIVGIIIVKGLKRKSL